MKNSNLLNRLLSYSHEKQKMGGMRRYAAMLIMLLTIGVGQMWASTFYIAVSKDGICKNKNTYTPQFQIKYGSQSGEWTAWGDMTPTGQTYGGKIVYQGTTDKTGYHQWQFRTVNGGDQYYYINWYNNNGGDATWNTDMHDGDLYDWGGSGWVDNPTYDAAYNVYFVNTGSWSTRNVYAYTNDCDHNADWPGVAMESDDSRTYKGDPIYRYNFSRRFSYLIFNDGSSNQTSDLSFDPTSDNKMYNNGTSLGGYHYDHYVIYNANGGTGSMSSDKMDWGEAENLTAIGSSITKSNYNFAGWTTNANGTGTSYADGAEITVNDNDITLYAQWKQVLTLDDNGGTHDGSVTVYYNRSDVTGFDKALKAGYHSDGYYTAGDDKVVNEDGTLVTGNVTGLITSNLWTNSGAKPTLYANWVANTYTVAFNANGGTGSMADETGFTYDESKALTLNNGSITRDGYFFDGWATSPEGAKVYNDGQNVSNLTSENEGTYTLYAHWVHVPALSTVTATPDDYNYQGEDITLNLSVTSTYQTTPAVKFFIHDGISTTIVTAVAGDVGVDAAKTTTHTATFTITDPRTYDITAKLYADPDDEEPVEDDHGPVTKAADDVVINRTYEITIVGARESSSSSETTVIASPDVANGMYANAYVALTDIPVGKKFTKWNLSTGLSLKEGCEITNREIQFYAGGTGTITAVYEDRASMFVSFDSVPGWEATKVFIWENGNSSNCNATYPGERMTTTTEYDGVKCFIYFFYTEGNGIEAFDENISKWNRISFNTHSGSATVYPGAGWNQTRDLTLANNHYYHFAEEALSTGSPYHFDWYVMGKWNGASKWDYTNPIEWGNYAIIRDLTSGTKQEFKIYRASTNEWFRYTTANTVPIGSEITLSATSGDNNDFTPDERAGYKFTLVKHNTAPTLTVEKIADSDVSVTVEAAANGTITTGPSTIHVYTYTTIAASANAGYRFKKWTVDDAHKNYIHIEDSTSATTTVYAKYASLGEGATITAHFSNENMIYCDISGASDWKTGEVYVCLYSSSYFDDSKGTGASGSQCFVKTAKMTEIGSSKIYYYDYSGNGHKDGSDGNPDFHYVAFTDKYAPEANNFSSMCVSYRGDFYPSAGRIFVMENYKEFTKNGSAAYYVGYWMKYREEEAGIKLKLYDGSNQLLYGCPFTFTHENVDMRTFTTTVKLNGGSTYRIELLGDNGIYYKNNGTYNTTHAGTYWQYKEREATVGYITTTGEGDYTFTLDCSSQLKMAASYPLKTGDYRIVYYGKTSTDDEDDGDFYGSPIAQWTSDTQIDKVSFFVTDADKDETMDWNLRVQYCSIAGSTVTWNDVAGSETEFDALDGKTGVYVFDVEQTSADEITIKNPEAYTGDFYIRTDIAEGRWEAYKEAADNKMVHSDWAKDHSGYDYYHCHYTPNGKSVKFTVANDYSSSISGELTTDSYTDSNAKLTANANVRFSYNSATNVIKRAYIGGSADDNYLNIVSPVADYVFTSGGTDLNGASAATRKFVDMGNWVYQMDIKAYPTATAKVTAKFKGDYQYFVGTESTAETILGGMEKGTQTYNLRAVYDFKNNHLMTSWVADGVKIGSDMTLNADLMIIRHLQEPGKQISFTGNKSISKIKTIYGAIQCDYSDMVGSMPNWSAPGIYGKLIYYISFPFDVNVKDIFGSAGNMDDQWIIQTYNGARRAKEGWFADSKPFWETLTVDSVMHANQGYVLILDRPSFNSASSVVWTNKSSGSSVYLYFPSADTDEKTISNNEQTVTVPAHPCGIKRTFYNSASTLVSHENTDSHWNMIGTPLFESHTAKAVSSIEDEIGLDYLYEWNSSTNTYSIEHVTTTYSFNSMHGYMVQFAGDVTFEGASLPAPAEIAARRVADNRNYSIKLQMTNEANAESRTFIELRENACDTFALNEDMYMMRSSNTVDVYTYAGNYDVAANVLSVGNHTIPVGLDVKKADTYTFSMPSNFSGSVTLVDNVANTRTNLAMDDYQVYLNQGAIEGRFYLEININNAPTAIDGVEDSKGILKDGKAHKFIENGQMYILKDGVIYDARGNRVQ